MRRFVTLGTDSLWRHGPFMRLWSAQTVSQLGDQVSFLALPLTAVLVLHASALQMGVMVALGGLPSILFGLLIGAWIDRRARKPVLLAADIGRFLLLAMIPLLHEFDLLTIGALYVITFLVGLLSLCFEVANRSLLPSLVERKRLTDANGKLELSRSASAIAGPALAGGLVQLITAPFAIGFDALSFLISALVVRTIDVREEIASDQVGEKRLWSEMRDGARFVLVHPVIRALFASSGTLSFFDAMLEAVFLLFLTRSLGLSAGLIGLIAAAGNVGFMIGALITPITNRLGTGPTIVSGIVVLASGDLVMPAVNRSTPLLIPLLVGGHFLFGLGLTLYNVQQTSARQSLTPDGMLGRMNAGYRFLVSGIGPLGALAGGALGVASGFRATLLLAGVGELAAVLWLLFSPVRSLSRLSDEPTLAPAATRSAE